MGRHHTMPRWPLLQPPTCVRGGWSSNISRITIEGRTLEDVQLGGWVYGPELGTAPVVLIVGGITASPFPFGDGQSEGDDPRAAWWPALCAPDLIDPAKHTVLCPSWPGNGSTWKGFDDPQLARIHFGRRPRRSRRGVARRLRLQRFRSPGSAPASAAWSAWCSRRAMPSAARS